MPDVPPLDLTRLKAAYAVESCSPTALIEALLPRLQASDQDAVWITRVEADVLRARARSTSGSTRVIQTASWSLA